MSIWKDVEMVKCAVVHNVGSGKCVVGHNVGLTECRKCRMSWGHNVGRA